MPGLARYQVAGLVLETAAELPELPPTDAVATCTFRRGPVAAFPASAAPGDEWIRTTRRGSAFVLEFAENARFEIDATGSEIVGDVLGGAPDATLRHLLLDHVVPRVLALRGHHVLHASAVRGPHGAIGILGASGWGKSTLATALARSGMPLLGDDALVLEPDTHGLRVRATYPGVRLWAEDVEAAAGPGASQRTRPVAHYTGKVRVEVGAEAGIAFEAGSVPLARLYVLDDPEGPAASGIEIEPLRAHDAFVALARHTFELDADTAAAHRATFERLTASPALRACSALRFPRDRAILDDVVAAIAADHARRDR